MENKGNEYRERELRRIRVSQSRERLRRGFIQLRRPDFKLFQRRWSCRCSSDSINYETVEIFLLPVCTDDYVQFSFCLSFPLAARLGHFTFGHREKGQATVSFRHKEWSRKKGKPGTREQKGWKHGSGTNRMENPQMEGNPFSRLPRYTSAVTSLLLNKMGWVQTDD